MPGMEQAWLLPAIPVVSFLLISAVGKILPRQGDFFPHQFHQKFAKPAKVHHFWLSLADNCVLHLLHGVAELLHLDGLRVVAVEDAECPANLYYIESN